MHNAFRSNERLPTILAGDRTVADDKSRGAKHHGPEPLQLVITQSTLAPLRSTSRGKGAFIHLHAGPIGGAIEPAILRPMAVRLLRGFEPMQHAPCTLEVARCDECTRRLDKVARPDEVVATEILVAFVEAPRNRETRDDSTRERTRLMRPNDGGTDAIGIGIADRSIELIMLLRQVVSRITWMGTTPRTTSSHWESPQLWHAAGGSHGQLAEGSPDRLAANRELSRRRGRQCDGPGRCDRSHREPVPYPRGVGRLRQDRSLAAVRFFGRIFFCGGDMRLR